MMNRINIHSGLLVSTLKTSLRGVSKLFLLVCFLLMLNNDAVAITKKSTKSAKLDKIAAVVNSDIITESELNQRINALKVQLLKANELIPADAVLRKQALDSLIDMNLQLQLAKRNNINVSDDDFNKAIENILKNNHITLAQLKESLAKEGTSYESFSRQVREQLLLSRLHQQAFGRDITVNEEEVAEAMAHPAKINPALQEYHLLDVLIPSPEGATTEELEGVKDKTNNILEKMQQGIDPFKLAANDSSIKVEDLGWRQIAALPAIFASKVAKMQAGSYAGPIEAPNGYHILKLEGVRGEAKKIKLTKEQAQDYVYHKKIEERAVSWLKEVRANAYVKILP